MQTAEEQKTQKPAPIGQRSCSTCGHIKVCGIFKAIAPLMQSFPSKPFEAEDLATICNEYISRTITDIVNGKTRD